MKRTVICFCMMIKRMGKHPVYWVLLMLFPAAFFIVPKFNKAADEKQIMVGYVMEEADKRKEESREMPGEDWLLDGIEYKMLENKGNLFQYIKYTDINDLKKDILTGRLSGGVVFGKNFTEKLRERDYWHCITLYLPEGMNVGGMIQEDVFGRVYQVYSAVWYAELLGKQGYQVQPEEILQKFSEYQKDGKVFAVNYEIPGKRDEGVQNTAGSESSRSSMLSLRGIFAFLTLMSASLGALDGSRDRSRGSGIGMPGQRSFRAIAVGAPILPAALFLAIGMLLGNYEMTRLSYAGITKLPITVWAISEFGSAFLYGLILWLLAILFSRLLSEKLLEGIMPCFLLMVLICCPIFLNLGENILLIRHLSKLFPITWYLEFWG